MVFVSLNRERVYAPHEHRIMEENFYVLKGTLQVEIDGGGDNGGGRTNVTCGAGENFINAPIRRMTIFSTSSPARHLPQTTNIWKKG